MPTRLSKFAISATCKDYVHPWTNSCINASTGLGLYALQESLRIYSMLYLIALLTKGRLPTVSDMKKTFLSIMQSTAFLTWSAFTFSMFTCVFRKLFGNFNVISVSFMPSFVSSFTALFIERPSRHPMLCLYVSNIATETLFRMAVSRGYLSAIPGGEIYIFAAGVTTLLYLFRSKSNIDDSIYKIIRFIVGPCETKAYKERNITVDTKQSSSKINSGRREKPINSMLKLVYKALKVYEMMINKIKTLGGKHTTCPHPNSCLHYVLGGAHKMFSLGLGVQMVLNVVFSMEKLFKKPHLFKKVLFKKGTFDLALFLGGFASLYKMVSCSLRRACNKDSPRYAIPAGLIASMSFYMYPSNTIALYFAWKALQMLWNNGVESGQVPEVKWFVKFLYCFSTAVLFHAAIMEPKNLRVSYWKFLYNLSGGRVAAMSRVPLDGFGLESRKQLQEVLKISRTTDKHNFPF
ncbi:transmembrane protein 135-like [Copidosoma floridanum]|uniref:transmembrane protein 135-like n=1 Tax=Copidosoma floridanum TaxID=29053 RepID=UPI0006C95639|nr:transmembrane protein 135-like [Copidosoma floridanum]XP_014216434.1 transmembrane protein 135-like [Copidosoma floridanum]